MKKLLIVLAVLFVLVVAPIAAIAQGDYCQTDCYQTCDEDGNCVTHCETVCH